MTHRFPNKIFKIQLKSSLVNKNATPVHFDKYGSNCLFYIDDQATFNFFFDRFAKLFHWTRWNGETPFGHFIYRNKSFKMPMINRKGF